MNKNLESVKFNLTKDMMIELIKFNELKKELNILKDQYDLTKDQELLFEMSELEIKLKSCRDSFIKKFRLNNHDEIIEYLNLKDRF